MNDTESLSDLLEELKEALKKEREALLSGQPIRIDAATQRKLALGQRIERATDGRTPKADARMLQNLARYNRDNSVICSAVLHHMTAAIDRLRQYDPHRSYRADGSTTNPPQHRLVRAA